ncbi:MAG: T9SS type A sorting domain-containing protein [Calditrichaeota bacterium]|nr:T9SS type A sorting domain-containing protein [Calditrichota bacterium]
MRSSNFRFKNFVLAIFVILLPLTPLLGSNQEDFDVIYYRIDVKIDIDQESVAGTVETRAVSLIDGLTQLNLDLFDNMTVSAVSGDASGFQHGNNILAIDLDKSYNQGDTVSVIVNYSGKPSAGSNFNPMTFDRSRDVVTISSESCPFYARTWWPCKDRPDDKPDSVDFYITVPANLTVAANGVLINVIDNRDGTETFYWQIRNPIATYLIAFSASNYQIIEDQFVSAENDTLPIRIYTFPEHYSKALVDFDNVSEMIEILSSYYGPYPYMNEKYGIVEYVGYWGGMEYQTITSLQPYLIQGNHSYESTFLHELAHQWWGDCVSPKDFHHTWLSEGFAVFSEALYYGHLQGEQRYHDYMNNENNALNLSGRIYRDDVTDPNAVYGYIVYNKGAWVIHMLRHVMGEENFWEALHQYRQQYEYSSATTEDFQHVFENVAGESLDWFFHEWIYEPGYPFYYYGWSQRENNGQYELKAFIDQIQQDAPLFKMPVDVTITTATKETTLVVTVEDSSQTFEYISDEPITDFKLDKNDWILKKTKVTTQPILKCYDYFVVDSLGNNNGLAEPGETIWLNITVVNEGTGASKMVAVLVSDDPDLEIPRVHSEFIVSGGSYGHLERDWVAMLPFTIKESAVPHISSLAIQFNADDTYTMYDTIDVKIGTPNIMLVDDDDGENFEQYLSQPLSLAKVYYETWDVKQNGVPDYDDILKNYQTVIWITGNDRTTTLTAEEQDAVGKFLDNGGWLLLSGQDIGYDLVADGSEQDSLFYSNYLHAQFLSDSVNSTKLIGVPNDPIAGGMFVYIEDKPEAASNQHSPSAIAALNGAETILKYIPQMTAGGIRYSDPASGAKLVYLAFGLEGISGPYEDTGQQLLEKIMAWFSGTSGVNHFEQGKTPVKYSLEQNYPNPFNSVTKIRFNLPDAGNAKLIIYNLAGQRIRELTKPDSANEFIWDGTDQNGESVASGIYIYELKGKKFSASRKLVLVK